MVDSETRRLLPNYNATLQPRANGTSSAGRGKTRFEMRQKMKQKYGSQRTGSIFDSVFSASAPSPPRPALVAGGGNARALATDVRQDPDPRTHCLLYTTLNPKSSAPSARLFQKIITVVILLDLVIYILSTEPALSHLSFFYVAEAVTSTIFAIEYIARLVVCTDKRTHGKHGPIRGRLKYMCSWHAVLDAFATFPFFVELISGVDLPTMTYLRIFRVLRISRTQGSCKAMEAVHRVLYFNSEILHVAALLAVYLIIVTSVLMYYLRPRGTDADDVDDPADFSSIPKTMVLSVLMLTGQGGPSGRLPWYTQIVVLLTGLFSIAMFAIPASMLTWGFEAEAERLATRAKKRALARRRGETVPSTSSSSSSSDAVSGFGDISTSDEEYMNIIGGGGEDEGSDANRVLAQGGPLVARVENLERSLAQTNIKLDLILQKLEGR